MPEPVTQHADRAAAIDEVRSGLRCMLAAQRRLRGRDAQRRGQLSFSQYHLLGALADGEAHGSGELAAAAELTPASVTRMLDHLAAEGLVERVRDADDRRRVAVRLTEEGRRRHAAKHEELREVWDRVLGDVTPAELRRLGRALRRIGALYDEF